MFKSLNINGWRQFEKINIEFHDRMTILTGANGAGKTTILKILSRHFGWQSNFVATPKKDKISGILKYVSSIWKGIIKPQLNQYGEIIGNIVYNDSKTADLMLPSETSNLYDININNQQYIRGIYLPSHRPIYKYARVDSIPTRVQNKDEVYNNYKSSIQSEYNIDQYYNGKKPTYIIKEVLISLATFGYGNQAIMPNENALDTFESFQNILKIVLPPKLGFKRIVIQMPEVLLETKTGTFPIDGVSGGIAAIIDLSWQIFMYSSKDNFVVIIDEPENHLHPELQRTILPNFLKAFPNAQFIVSTHNPFIISSVPDSNVYVLDYNENNAVVSKKLDIINRAGSSNDILREVLGVPFTMPLWVEKRLGDIVDKFSKLDMNNKNFDLLRKEMKDTGLEKFFPDTMVRVIEKSEGND